MDDHAAPVFFRAEEVAHKLALSRAMIIKLMNSGEIRSVKMGAARRIPAAAVDEYIAGLREVVIR